MCDGSERDGQVRHAVVLEVVVSCCLVAGLRGDKTQGCFTKQDY